MGESRPEALWLCALTKRAPVQLLQTLSIRGNNGPDKLLKCIKGPVTKYLPPNTTKLTLSADAPTIRLREYVTTLPKDHNIAVFIGAMARG